MQFQTRYPLLLVAIALAAGIIIRTYLPPSLVMDIVLGLVIVATIVWEVVRKEPLPLLTALFLLTGYLLTHAALPSPSQIPAYDTKITAIATIQTPPTTKNRWHRAKILILSSTDSTAVTRATPLSAIINIDTSTTAPQEGDTILFTARLRQIEGGYGRSLALQGTVGQLYTYNPQIIARHSSLGLMTSLRTVSDARLRALDTSRQDATAIMSAMTTGLRTDIPAQVTRSYRQAGVAHLLAISGLHIGMIVAMLNVIFGVILLHRRGRVIFSIAVIATLWFYTVFCGMAPSVLRAAIMFTLYQVALLNARSPISLNILSGAAIILLAINPLYLFDVGFELSFVAMIGISTLMPTFGRLWQPKNRFLRGVWTLVALSMAAQIAVTPLVIYIFGYTSLLGVVTGLLLWLSVPIIIVGSLLYLLTTIKFVGLLALWTTDAQNALLNIIGNSPLATIDNITEPLWLLLLIYALLIAGAMYLDRLSRKKLRKEILQASYTI